MRRGEDSASALVRKAGVDVEYFWPKLFSVEHVRTNTAWPQRAGRANRTASRLSRPDQIQPFPPRRSPDNFSEDSGETNMYLSSDDMPLHQHARFPRSAGRVLAADADPVK